MAQPERKPIKSFRWIGGKTCVGRAKQGKWIIDSLPSPSASAFAEIYGGSAAIMLNRPPTQLEIYNDIDGRLVRFFDAMQSPQAEDIIARIETTLVSEEIFGRAKALLDAADFLDSAWAFAVVTSLRYPRQQDIAQSDFYVHMQASGTQLLRADWRLIAERCRKWIIYQRPAEKLLRQLQNTEDIDIYCDPPYYQSENSTDAYGIAVDVEALTDLLLAQKGKVAISGMADEWEHLGWRKTEKQMVGALQGLSGKEVGNRNEILWMNYPPNNPQLFASTS